MFKKLRNKLIAINLGVTSVVIVVVFSTIYFVSTRSAETRPPMMNSAYETNEKNSTYETNENWLDFEAIIATTVRQEKAAAAKQLMITLIASGFTIEATVALISYFMAEEAIKPVREAYETQKIFIANASHEIKTPLAAISANLEAADISDNHWIRNVEIETAKLAALNASLLTLARTDLVEASTPTETDLAALIEKNIQILTPRLKNHTFSKKIILREKIKINRGDFEQIFSILMDNAIKYGKKKLYLELTPHKLAITNDGKEISAEQIVHVFDRFYQTDKTAEGVGLGLSIAKSLAERNHWTLEAKSGGGTTTFTLIF